MSYELRAVIAKDEVISSASGDLPVKKQGGTDGARVPASFRAVPLRQNGEAGTGGRAQGLKRLACATTWGA